MVYYLPVCRANPKFQHIWLFLTSYFFYGFTEWKMIPLLLGSIIIFYGIGVWLKSEMKSKNKKKASNITTMGVVWGICILLYFNTGARQYMIIGYIFHFKLSIIRVFLILRWGEKLHDVILGEQRTAQDSHDLHDWTSKLEVMLNDSDETVGDNDDVDLNTHRIVTLSPERLNLEVLFDPFEEQLDLPPVFVKESNVLGSKIEVVRVVSERTVQVRGIIDDTPDLVRILLLVLLLRKDNDLVTQDIARPVKNIFAVNDFIVRTLLLADDKEAPRYCNLVKPCEVKVSPAKERHAEADSSGVHSIESSVQFKLSGNPSILRKKHHIEVKLLKDADNI